MDGVNNKISLKCSRVLSKCGNTICFGCKVFSHLYQYSFALMYCWLYMPQALMKYMY